ncbi:MAG TPA: LytTR family DNA-binding domain-containing protein [Usitatibacter sp.]|jgi:DNA-binding LytR/AlgR family response regulator|nr:LytTR family DNA-binding domain-containing protein [Usitatibacter sp.]
MKPRAVLAEDESLLREQLRELLAAAWPELEIVAVAEDGKQAIRAMEEHEPDVLFLDIQMPEASGLEVARLANGRCHVAFVTAYDQYAVAAFEEGAVDYVMKPLSGARIAVAVQRLKQRIKTAPANLGRLLDNLANPPPRNGQYLRWINASRGEDVQLITIEEVKFFQSDSKYTRVVAAKSEGLIRKSIKELVDELDPSIFWQIHRATIVNLNAVEIVGRDLRGHVVLRLKDRPELLQVSQPYAHLFRQM